MVWRGKVRSISKKILGGTFMYLIDVEEECCYEASLSELGYIVLPNQKVYAAADEFSKCGIDEDGTVEELLSECMDDKLVNQVIFIVEKYNPAEDRLDLYNWFLEAVNKVIGQEVYEYEYEDEDEDDDED